MLLHALRNPTVRVWQATAGQGPTHDRAGRAIEPDHYYVVALDAEDDTLTADQVVGGPYYPESEAIGEAVLYDMDRALAALLGEVPRPSQKFRGVMEATDPALIADALYLLADLWAELRRVAADLESLRPGFRTNLQERIKKEEGCSVTQAKELVREHPAYLGYQERTTHYIDLRDDAETTYNALNLRGWALIGKQPIISFDLIGSNA